MLDKIITLVDGRKYVILDKTVLDDTTYYYALRLTIDEEPTNNYLFFEEISDDEILPVEEEDMKGLLLTAFAIKFVDKAYDM